MIRSVKIRAAGPADMQAISKVLHKCGLPSDDVEASVRLYHVAVLDDNVIGCACGEQFDDTIVVHTVAVLQDYRDQRVATHLVGALLMRARANGCTTATLLTAEHPSFFARYGFTLTSVDAIPKQVKLTKEFQRRFGARTHCMCRRLD
ncbi:GNAT family N-acetyltransferase [Cupriavidus sp. SK-3]|uniref:GNAT family N-acetyltransferase n=1 Tax=Cupriavidus sp. SK-3 TaxID=1470558 RepID=UPI0009DFBED0|nr:GNAT family N-acetyltransferase [Cupriavidus sp. SK-3]